MKENLPVSLQKLIHKVEETFAEDPAMVELFINCFSNTLDTTVKKMEDGTTHVITGDIPAMWLRDSVAQVRPYLVAAAEDQEISDLLAGLSRRQFFFVNHDPYANAFNQEENGNCWDHDETEMSDWLWERKYEIDSLCYPVQFAYLLWKNTGRTDHFDDNFVKGLHTILNVWKTEQYHEEKSPYSFQRKGCYFTDTLSREGKGALVKSGVGLTWSGFRPSDDACIYGHALEGNYHFILNQSFSTDTEVKRYEDLMNDVKTLVVDKYDGSLKAEHGTGRNMAPFVKYEWGEAAFEAMKAVKQLFDPKGLLNPGVIFNDDPQCHIKNFKPLPLIPIDEASPAEKVNKCIECGFCEVNCLSCGFTLSSRQRIVLQREISRLKQSGTDLERLSLLEKQYRYPGNQTCAGDGLCSMSCPMNINTGDLTHIIRQEALPKGSLGYKAGDFVANHFAGVKSSLRPVLSLANFGHSVLGTKAMSSITKGMHNVLGVPLWTPAMPKAYSIDKSQLSTVNCQLNKVVYFPSCINQTMGLPKHSPVEQPLVNKMISLLQKGGYEVIFPKEMDKLCCGTIWESKGMLDIADRKAAELEAALWEASEQGKYPVLCDQSPCLHRMRETIQKMKLYEPAEFIYTFLRDKLVFTQTDRPVAVQFTSPAPCAKWGWQIRLSPWQNFVPRMSSYPKK